MTIYTLDIAALKAHLIIAATKDRRLYLNGVFLDGTSGHLVSTDGGALLATKHSDLKGAPSVIMPRDVLVKALKQVPKKAFTIDVTIGDGGLTFIPAPGVSLMADAVDAGYPQWRQVVPATCSGEAGHYDPSLLARVGDALQALAGAKTQQQVRLWQNGPERAALATLTAAESAPPHVAVIMPLRTSKKEQVTSGYVADVLA